MRIGFSFPPLIVLVSLSVALIWQIRLLQLGRKSEDWPSTTGKVLKAFVDESYDEDNDVSFSANVRYSYRVGNQLFESTRLTYRPLANSRLGHAADALRGIFAGREIEVFYDPEHPSRSVLRPGYDNSNYVIIGLLAAAIVGVLIFGL